PAQLLLKTGQCQLVQAAFFENCRRAMNLVVIPAWSFIAHEQWAHAMSEAFFKTISAPPLGHDAVEKLHEEAGVILSAIGQVSDEVEKRMFTYATRQFITVVGSWGGEGIHEALEGLLQGVVIQMWTAFEVMVGDLLTGIATGFPSKFPGLAARSLNFASRESFRNAYLRAFPPSLAAIHNPLNDLSVNAICLLRNSFVHSGGLVDQIFKDGCQECGLTKWAGMAINTKFDLDGEIIETHVERLISSSLSLLSSVDSQLI
ncbi:MAG TPA: hypothetical protein VHY22_01765, partial [Chthoniobacteraceae bacterium]|nr:hypothetical protein [Chthoniobacteraceae bacterium]